MKYVKVGNGNEMWKQLRAIRRKYGEDSWRVIRATSILAATLGYPEWKMVYHPIGVMEITMIGEYGTFGLYVRDEYEVWFGRSFIRTKKPLEVKKWIENRGI